MNDPIGLRGYNRDDSPKAVVETPRVQSQLDNQEKAIQSVGGLLQTLEDRLSPVLRKEPAAPCGEKCAEPPSSNLVSDRIQKHNKYIGSVADRIQELLRLLEV